MKKGILIVALTFCLASFTQSCKKGSASQPPVKTIDVVLRVNQSYHYDLGSFGIEEGAKIVTQASHFLISSVYRDTTGKTPNIFYRYTPAAGFTGRDEVMLKSERGSNGASANTNITYTSIQFTIRN